jgi:hypothetical protein
MSEETVPKPFPEARPPHLPDILTRQSPWAYVFAIVTVILVVNAASRVGLSEPQLIDYGQIVSLLIPSALMPLLEVVVFVRHPDARSSMPLLVFGIGLLSAVELLEAVDTPIYDVLAGPDLAFDAPSVVAYGVFKSLVRLFGVLYMGAGIAAARQLPMTRTQRPLAIWLVALTIVGVVVGPVALASMVGDLSAVDVVAAVIGIVLTLGVTLAWAYVVWVIVDGSLAGEIPGRAWLLAAIATAILFAFRVVSGLFVAFGEAAFTVSVIAGYASLVAWLLLFVAFVLGLPTPAAGPSAGEATADPPGVTPPGSGAG